MVISSLPAQLNQQRLSKFKTIFANIKPPQSANLRGTFKAEFVGPRWLRRLAPLGLVFLGLGGWWGKDVKPGGQGLNIVERNGEQHRKLGFRVLTRASNLDGQPCLAVQYDRRTPFPWPWMADELRQLDDATLLGMTYLNVRPFRRLSLPFLLHRVK
jgi:hypothetical protein